MQKRFIGIKEFAEYLGITVNTAYSWVYRRRVPYVKVGKLVKFDIYKINEWVDKNSVAPHYKG